MRTATAHTATTAPGAPASAAPSDGGGALAPLVGDAQEFLSRHWTRTPLLRRAVSPDAFAGLLSLEALTDLLTSRALRLPHVRLVRDGQQVAESQYTGVRRIGHGTVTDAIDPGKVLSHFGLGATLVLDAVELLVPAVGSLCERLAASLSCPVDAVAFLTPPDRKGLAAHIDDEDVFVLQLSGSKQWTVHEQLRPVPLTPGALPASALGPVALTPLLEPGDVLYVPRGTPHHAESTGGHSLHLSLAARRPTLSALTADTLLAALRASGPDRDLNSLAPAREIGALVHARASGALARLDTVPVPVADGAGREGDALAGVLRGLAALAVPGTRYAAGGGIGLTYEEDGAVVADFGRFSARFPSSARGLLERLAAGGTVGAQEFTTDGAAGTGTLSLLLVRGALRLAS
ncbi:cupin superfamily protein [Streptomyces sp. 2132.2]|uniref:cupin domain-containing protein n=1 Tax=Streptomyces sp. 2132.2 TaxID=2485161 RepID=UPI000F4AC1D4|nr:cupin domain-containing protein [Streptomyces sp. 2132.2]ROQ88893.1 cupin superfamily protein [Streptomyces sp. 2132.2]